MKQENGNNKKKENKKLIVNKKENNKANTIFGPNWGVGEHRFRCRFALLCLIGNI
jgi:hypothetical protein